MIRALAGNRRDVQMDIRVKEALHRLKQVRDGLDKRMIYNTREKPDHIDGWWEEWDMYHAANAGMGTDRETLANAYLEEHGDEL